MTNMVQQLATALAGRYEVKVLKPELAAVLGSERFVVEIKTTAALQHPHILPVFDSGTAGGSLYYVMPYLVGETVREKLNRETQFSVDEMVALVRGSKRDRVVVVTGWLDELKERMALPAKP